MQLSPYLSIIKIICYIRQRFYIYFDVFLDSVVDTCTVVVCIYILRQVLTAEYASVPLTCYDYQQ